MENFIKIFREHFTTEPYNILEIGSRDGHDAEKLRLLTNITPNHVYVVEPHPESAKRIRETYPEFNVYECAINKQMGIFKFNAFPYNYPMDVIGTSSLLPRSEEYMKAGGWGNPQYWIKVIGITGSQLLELIDAPNIDLAKIDVEGASFEVLQSFGDDIRYIKIMHLEVENIKMWDTPATKKDVYNLLRFYNYKEVYSEVVYGTQVDCIWKRLD